MFSMGEFMWYDSGESEAIWDGTMLVRIMIKVPAKSILQVINWEPYTSSINR